MKALLPTAGTNPHAANRDALLKAKIKEAAKSFTLVSEKGRIPRKRKKHVYKAERVAYTDLILSVMVELAKRKLQEQQKA